MKLFLLFYLHRTSLYITELAEYVLNKCIERTDGGSDEPDMGRPVQMAPTSRQKQTSVLYDFQYLDDLLPEGASKVNKVGYIPIYTQ